MDRLLQIAHAVARVGAWCGGALILAAAVLVAVDVVIRNLFVVTFGGSDELAGYALAVGSAWALAFALLERAHVRIDVLYQSLPVRAAALVDILCLSAFTLFVVLLTRHGYGVLMQSLTADTHSMSALAVRLAIPQAMWVLGLALFVAVALLLLLRAALALLAGDAWTVVRLLGSRSATEEVEQELDQAGSGRSA
ncbi:MAG TPA: TRAP transporter small permease [Geminicoccaceae bacterium]|nr:TRAP transporter small permease [Geminicoccaceae bacterium]